MNRIKGLMVKDLSTLKSYKFTIVLMLIIFIGSGFLNEGISLSIIMPLIFGMLAISSFSYDNLAKSDKYILTFPINKNDIVKARYIFIFMFTLIGSLLGLVCTILVQSIMTGNFVNKETLENNLVIISGALCGIMFLQIFQIPIMYKFGAEKGRIIQLIMIVALMLGGSLITTTLMNFFGISLDNLVEMLENYLMIIIGIIVIILYLLSYLVSCKFIRTKKFKRNK